jgi:hypothetical protein
MAISINGTTGIAGVDGSASTPAVQGTDTNTGIFYPAADTIAFAEGGAEVARFNADAQFVAAAGTASLPVLTTTGDLNTGVFYPAADTIAFAEGGAEAMRINSSGELLVGTTASAGLVSNSRSVVAGGFRSLNGELTTLTSGTPYTLFTAPADFCTYLVNVHGGASSTAYSETAIVQDNNGSIRVDIISAGGNIVIDNSGTNIRVTQNSGISMGFLVWSAVRMA